MEHETQVVPRICAFINPLSGGRRGREAMKVLSQVLRSDDVIEEIKPKEGGPRPGLQRLVDRVLKESEKPRATVILACGGDGTFNWISSTLLDITQEVGGGGSNASSPSAPAALLDAFHILPMPLGTGNDLSRCLGWGSGYPGGGGGESGRARVERFVQAARIGDAKFSVPHARLDLWSVSFGDSDSQHSQQQLKFSQFQNYFSVGVDAEAAHRFDVFRDAHPRWCSSQLRNKACFAAIGAMLNVKGAATLGGASHPVAKLLVDDREVTLPAGAKSIILLNIPTFASGTQPWGKLRRGEHAPTATITEGPSAASPSSSTSSPPAFSPPRIDDGMLEVVCVHTIMSLGIMNTRLGKFCDYRATRLAQGR
jgi:diacylglycerol kinase (ATP)